MPSRIRYLPPQISPLRLQAKVLGEYQSHKLSQELIASLVAEYLRFWRLVLSYKELRIVAPGPILAVQQVHQKSREDYFADCMGYFNRYVPLKEMAWGGTTDIQGAVQTVTSYKDLFCEPPGDAWSDLTALFLLRRLKLRPV